MTFSNKEWQTSISVTKPYTTKHVSKFRDEGKTIAAVLKAKFESENAKKNKNKLNEVEQSYKKCLDLIKLQALNTLNHNSQIVYWEKIWMFYWWGVFMQNISTIVDINTKYEIGQLLNIQFQNWKNKQLAEDLDKEWLVMRLSYNNSWIWEWSYTNISLQELEKMPEHRDGDPLNIWISLK